jgi:predicted nucleotidyltransferase
MTATYGAVSADVDRLGEAELTQPSRCLGWTRADLLYHMLLDAQRALITFGKDGQMRIPAQEMAERATAWAGSDPAVRAAVVYGSVAQGSADGESDLDLVIVAEPGQREALWARREQISARLHGGPVVWSQEPFWQRPYRYQTWQQDLTELDLTFDEEHVAPWAALARGFRVLVDKGGTEARLQSDLASWRPPEVDAATFEPSTWLWLGYLRGKLRHGQTWMVRYGVMDTLNNRVLPLLGTAGHSAARDLDAADLARLERAAPASSDPGELLRSLRATAGVYAWALGRWAERTGRERPRGPLTPAIAARLNAELELD